MPSEAQARIKIDQLLQQAGWRFFDDESGPATIQLEGGLDITQEKRDAFGNDFESTQHGYADYILLDEHGFPFIILEAKRESKNPLVGKEQARQYAYAKNVRFVILSNGNLHYFWDLDYGNPEVITEFPTYESIQHRQTFQPDPARLASEPVGADFIALSQDPNFMHDPRYTDESQRAQYLRDRELRILRPYQLKAVESLQRAARAGSTRFLFEMATGTGKTLVSAAVIKLFLKTGNAKRVLFLVDRIELENQAFENFKKYLSNDYTAMVFKRNRDNWRHAEIVVSTVQSFVIDNKYMDYFSPTDFDLVISDEAHRSINGNSRAVFEYFIGFKLGLTATPKDYLKHINPQEISQRDPRAWERRQLLDTYRTFGCDSGEPTYRYSLLDGVKDGYLVNPIVADARTEITTQLLSEQGYAVMREDEEGEPVEQTYFLKDFERRFFSEETNHIICQTFLENARTDPITGEVGKSIMFCVSQNHAAKMANILNQLAMQRFPGKYNSDFAVQITSDVPGAQGFAINFANNNLNGKTCFLEAYESAKTRVCVTVGMMTTGYDCRDILNLCMVRPIFSPTDFIQIKGRGTRTFDFKYETRVDGRLRQVEKDKQHFKLFDFFANCEYFEEEFDYDQVLRLPRAASTGSGGPPLPVPADDELTIYDKDPLTDYQEQAIGLQGMRVDRELFQRFTEPIKQDLEISAAVQSEQWDTAVRILRQRYENKPEDFVTLTKLMRNENLDRRLTWKEVLQRAFGIIEGFKSKDQLLEEEFKKFIAIHKPGSDQVLALKNFLKAYITSPEIQEIIDKKEYTRLATNPMLPLAALRELNGWLDVVPEYVKDYVSLNTYKQ